MSEGADWPALGYERRPWRLDERAPISRTQRRAHAGPYEAAVVPHLAEIPMRLTPRLLAVAEDAAVEIARFDAYVRARLDRTGEAAEVGPMESVLLRSESASSSQIEQITVGARQLALAELGERTGDHARLVARNVAVMRAAMDMADRIDAETILRMHRTLLETTDPDNAGRWRDQQVWIGGSGAGPHRAVFVPPHHERVEADVADLVAFVGRDDVPAVAHAALAHAQFETIHPFTDGNGRTGRALLHAMLRASRVTERVTAPISAGLLSDVDAYFDALGAYRRGDPTPVVEQFCYACFGAIDNGRLLVERLVETKTHWTDRVTARSDAAVWRLLDVLVRHPVVNNALVRSELGVTDVAAQGAIDQLVAADVLEQTTRRARNRAWQSPEILAALDDFAARAGRRRTAGEA